MQPYLKQVTAEIFENHTGNFQNIAIVFPNKRASLYFQKYISEVVNKPIFLPELYTIDEIIGKFSNLVVIDDIALTYYLFNSFKKYIKTTENFDDFYFWGQMLLSDFDDIDKELVNAKDIFTNLLEQKEIDFLFETLTAEQIEAVQMFWNAFKAKNESEHKKKFLEVWNQLYNIYTDFNKQLNTNKKAYTGMLYRDAESNFTTEKIQQLDLDKIYFIGFNALNKVERNLFSFLQKENIGEFYWDYDEYYLKHKIHEAGFFIKNNIKNYPSQSKILKNCLTQEKNVEFISTPSSVGQAKIISTLLKEFETQKDYDINKTAIILADETLLIPTLHSLPPNISKLNVTMGFPIKETPAFNLLVCLIELQIQKDKENKFYYKSVKAVLNHPYISGFNFSEVKEILNDIKVYNKINVSVDYFEKNECLKQIFTPINKVEKISSYLLNIIEKISVDISDTENTDKLSVEYLSNLFLTVKKVNDLLLSSKIELNVKTYFSILKTVLSSKIIPFEGEPIGGLQVMGILETRLLDFENVILLSMNEGLLPKTGATNSFITYNLRRGFGIPTIEHQDSIYGYYFYRILQRAKNIRLVYNSSVGNSSKEMSRFLSQIKYEKLFNIKERNFSFKTDIPAIPEIVIEKNKEIVQRLNEYLKNENPRILSPSALNTYIDCSLMFYFRYIASIKPPEEVTEEIDYAVFGSILHKAIETLYKEFEQSKKLINTSDLVSIKEDKRKIEQSIIRAFSEEYFNGAEIKREELKGRNAIIFDIITKYIKAIINKDIEHCPFSILGLEQKYYFPLTFDNNGTQQRIITGGIIDRIDKKEGVVRVLDYKTGSAGVKFKSTEQLTNSDVNNRPKAVLQTFVYAEAFAGKNKQETIIEPGIIKVKEILSEKYETQILFEPKPRNTIPVKNYLEYRTEFKLELSNIVSEIFDKEGMFSQTNDEGICSYCDYKNICHKE